MRLKFVQKKQMDSCVSMICVAQLFIRISEFHLQLHFDCFSESDLQDLRGRIMGCFEVDSDVVPFRMLC